MRSPSEGAMAVNDDLGWILIRDGQARSLDHHPAVIAAKLKEMRQVIVIKPAEFPSPDSPPMGAGMLIRADATGLNSGETPLSGPPSPAKSKTPVVILRCNIWGPTFGGGELTTLAIAKRLIDAGLDLHVSSRRPGPGKKHDWWDDVPHEIAIDGANAISHVKPSIALFQDAPSNEELRACLDNNIPYVCQYAFWQNTVAKRNTPEDWTVIRDGDLLSVLDPHTREALWRALRVFPNSPWMAERLGTVMAGRRIDIATPEIVESAVCAKKGKPKYVLMPQAQRGKGMEVFLDLAKDFPDVPFVAMNPLGLALEQLQRDAKARPNVSAHPWTNDMASLYAEASVVFIGTQTAETFCRAAAEARINGIPLLVSDAGNLPNFVKKPGHGRVVKHDAPYPEWKAAFEDVLALKGKARRDRSWLCGGADTIAQEVGDAVCGRDMLILRPTGAPGVQTACRHLTVLTGATLAPWNEDAKHGPAKLTIMAGGFGQEYREIVARRPGRKALWWCSSTAQMKWHPNELAAWENALNWVANTGNLIFTTCPGLAHDGDEKALGCVRWLPAPFALAEAPMPWLRPAPRDPSEWHMPILGPNSARKRLPLVVQAARMADIALRMSSWVTRASTDAGGITPNKGDMIHDMPDDEAIKAMLGMCDVAVRLSAAETFSYAAAMCMMSSLPTIAVLGTPVAQYPPGELYDRLQVEDGENIVADVVDRLLWLKGHPEDAARLGDLCRLHAYGVIEKNNAEARAAIKLALNEGA